MWSHNRGPRTLEIQLRDRLNGLEREWLVARLTSTMGVLAALCRQDSPRLLVAFDPAEVCAEDLVDLLFSSGIPPCQHGGLDAPAFAASIS